MRLKDLLKTILSSNEEQWKTISCWGYGSGPSYKNMFTFYNVFYGQENVLKVDSHSDICIYKEDIDIIIAYGITINDDFKAKWANQFPDPNASSEIVDIFYKNSLVFREEFLYVDGGRCKLPIPSYREGGDLVVSKDYYDFIKLFERITSRHINDNNFNYYFNQTGIKVIDEEWI